MGAKAFNISLTRFAGGLRYYHGKVISGVGNVLFNINGKTLSDVESVPYLRVTFPNNAK